MNKEERGRKIGISSTPSPIRGFTFWTSRQRVFFCSEGIQHSFVRQLSTADNLHLTSSEITMKTTERALRNSGSTHGEIRLIILYRRSLKYFFLFYYWRLTLSFWGSFVSSTIILLGWGGQEQAWLVLMWSSNDSYLSLDFWVVSCEFITLLY